MSSSGPEAQVLAAILHYLALRGVVATRVNAGLVVLGEGSGRRVMRGAAAGTSDILGCIPSTGRFLAVEVKAGRNQPTKAQRDYLARVESAGGLGIVARSVEDVERILDEEEARGRVDSYSQRAIQAESVR